MNPIALEVQPLDPVLETRIMLRFTDSDDAAATVLNGEAAWPGIVQDLALSREGWNGDWRNNVAVPQAAVDVALNALRAADPVSPRYRWSGAPFRVYRDAGAGYELLFNGLVKEAGIESNSLKVTSEIDAEPFEEDVLNKKFDGRLGEGGFEALKDVPMPALFGYCLNVEPMMINVVDYIYRLHAYGSIEGVVKVFERGIDFGVGVGDFADYAALLAALVPEGRWATCNALGYLRMGAPPAGIITADVKGDNVGGFHQTTAAIVARLCEIASIDPGRLDAASMAAFAADVPYPVNLYMTQQEKVVDTIRRIVLPCNAQVSFSWLGQLQVSRFNTIPPSTMELSAQGRALPPVLNSNELSVAAPVWSMKMNYARAWRPLSKDEIALDPNAIVPVTVWKRAPTKPDPPMGNNIPEGWVGTRPQFEQPLLDVSGDMIDGVPVWTNTQVYQGGPVWKSIADQVDGITVGVWDDPTLDDSDYRGFTLATDNQEAMLEMTSSAVRSKPWLSWHPNEDNAAPVAFIPEGVKGPWVLSFSVRHGAKMFGAGVMVNDPHTYAGARDSGAGLGYIRFNDFFAGVFAVNNNQQIVYHYDVDGQSPLTGIFPFFNYHYDGNYIDDEVNALTFTMPQDNSTYQVSYNGQTIEIHVNGQHVRSSYLDMVDWDVEGFWPVFAPLDDGQEIYDIVWEPAAVGRRSRNHLPLNYTEGGALRIRDGESGFEMTSAFAIYEAFGYAFGSTEAVDGGMMLSFTTNVPLGYAGYDANPAFTQFGYIYPWTGYENSMGFRFSAANGGCYSIIPGPTTSWFTYNSGDTFAVEYTGTVVRYFRNGEVILRTSGVRGLRVGGYFELGAQGWIRRFVAQSLKNEFVERRGQVEASSYQATFYDTDTPDITVGGYSYYEVARTPTLNVTATSFFDLGGTGTTTQAVLNVLAQFFVTNILDSAPLTVISMLQVSYDGGSSWSELIQNNIVYRNAYVNPPESGKIVRGVMQPQLGTFSAKYRVLINVPYAPIPWGISISNLVFEASYSG